MNERLFTLAGAGLAVVLLLWLFTEDPLRVPIEESRPTSQDAGPAGLLGLRRWLEQSGIPVQGLNQRYSGLAAASGAAEGNLLVIADPMVWPVRPAEVAPLRDWVAAGNHVLLLRTGAQRADWAQTIGDESGDLLKALALRTISIPLQPDAGELPDPALAQRRAPCSTPSISRGTTTGELRRLRPASGQPHPVLSGVREALVKTPLVHANGYQALEYDVTGRTWLPLLCDAQRKVPVLSLFRLGSGRVWAFDYSEVFSNGNLDRGDNALLAANLIGFALGPGGSVIFDDMHQGHSALYDPDAFFADPRLHGTLAFLIGIWLVWLLGYSNRFSAPPARAPAATLLDLAQATGRFYSRYLRRDEAARGLFHIFFNHVRWRRRLPLTGEPAWELLADAPPANVAELRAMHAKLSRGRVDLQRLRNLLLDTQHRLP